MWGYVFRAISMAPGRVNHNGHDCVKDRLLNLRAETAWIYEKLIFVISVLKNVQEEKTIRRNIPLEKIVYQFNL